MTPRRKRLGLQKSTEKKPSSEADFSGRSRTVARLGVPDSPWDLLGIVLIEDILARLAVPKILQCRSVCKKWKRVIDSPDFSQFHDNKSSPEICFLVSWASLTQSKRQSYTYRAYFPSMDRWLYLPPHCIQPRRSTGPLASAGPRTRSKDIAASTSINCAGIWCIQGELIENLRSSFRVCGSAVAIRNPATGWVNKLPVFPDSKLRSNRPCHAVSVVVNQTNGSFKVLCAGIHKQDCEQFQSNIDDTCLSCQLFDSRTQQWTAVADLPYKELRFRYDSQKQISQAVWGNLVYYAVLNGSQAAVLSFDLVTGVWNEIPGETPQQNSCYLQDSVLLFKREQSLILVMRRFYTTSFFDCWFPHIYCWDLGVSPSIQNWVEVKTSDPHIESPHLVSPLSLDTTTLSQAVLHATYLPLSWRGLGDFILFSSLRIWGLGGLLYSLSTNSWKIVFGLLNDSEQLDYERISPQEHREDIDVDLTGVYFGKWLTETFSLVMMVLEVPLSSVQNSTARHSTSTNSISTSQGV